MGRMYTISIAPTAVTVAADIFEITPADDKPCVLHAIYLGQTTEIQDAAEEQLGMLLIRGFTASGSGGTATTPRPLNPSDAAAGFAAEMLNTTAATTGTTNDLHRDTWNVRMPYQLIFTPEMRPIVTQANTTLILRLTAAPADSITITATVYFEELG